MTTPEQDEQFYRDTENIAFPKLTDERLALLRPPETQPRRSYSETVQGTSALASARGKSEEAEVLQVPAPKLRRALAEMPKTGAPIVSALIMRRMRL